MSLYIAQNKQPTALLEWSAFLILKPPTANRELKIE